MHRIDYRFLQSGLLTPEGDGTARAMAQAVLMPLTD
jgi:hypothetical protein